MAEQITEEMGVHKAWYEEARKITPETLPAFIKKLAEDYTHDYGTVCHAVAAAAIAGAQAINHSPSGGITGFQASCVMWEFIQKWMHLDGQPLQLVRYDNMLYPQYDHDFEKTITAETWKYLQEKAHEHLAATAGDGAGAGAHSDVVAHWKSIADGNVPFGYSIKAES